MPELYYLFMHHRVIFRSFFFSVRQRSLFTSVVVSGRSSSYRNAQLPTQFIEPCMRNESEDEDEEESDGEFPIDPTMGLSTSPKIQQFFSSLRSATNPSVEVDLWKRLASAGSRLARNMNHFDVAETFKLFGIARSDQFALSLCISMFRFRDRKLLNALFASLSNNIGTYSASGITIESSCRCLVLHSLHPLLFRTCYYTIYFFPLLSVHHIFPFFPSFPVFDQIFLSLFALVSNSK